MLTLYRTYLEDRTEGEFMLPDGTMIYTLERPWLNNIAFKSCIPEGIYVIERDHTGRHQWWRVTDVEGGLPLNYMKPIGYLNWKAVLPLSLIHI